MDMISNFLKLNIYRLKSIYCIHDRTFLVIGSFQKVPIMSAAIPVQCWNVIDSGVCLVPGLVPAPTKIPNYKYAEYFVMALKKSGFPGLDIVKYLRKNSETTKVTGTFIVKMLLSVSYSNSNNVNNNIIDIVTTCPNVVSDLAGIIATKFCQSDLTTGFSCEKLCHFNGIPNKTVTFSSNLTTIGEETITGPTKINIVTLNASDSVINFIDSISNLSISKTYFDGFNIKHIGSIKRHFDEMRCNMRPRHKDIYSLENTLRLAEKYMDMGFIIKLPSSMRLDTPIILTEEFITGMIYQYYSKKPQREPIKMMYKGQDKCPLVSSYFTVATTHVLYSANSAAAESALSTSAAAESALSMTNSQ